MSPKRKVAAALILLSNDSAKDNRNRRMWVRKWILRRKEFGAFHNLQRELRIEDPEQYRNFIRMSKTDLEILLNMVGPMITKRDTNFGEAISAPERLVLTLRFLASGDSYSSLQYTFRIPPTTIARIVPEVCQSIYDALKPNYLKVPNTRAEWESIAQGFAKKWNFPQCLGALDGKHVALQAPENSGSLFFNYKVFHSIVLMALVDADYRIIYMDVGCNGRVADGGVFSNCSLSSALENNTLNLPPPSPLPGREKQVPYVIVADDAFPMKEYLLKPYPNRDQPGPNRVFNYRESRARRTSENCFGISSNTFRVLRKPMLLRPERAQNVVCAVCALHNFLSRKESTSQYIQNNSVDSEHPESHEVQLGAWRTHQSGSLPLPLQSGSNRNYTQSAKLVRDEYRD